MMPFLEDLAARRRFGMKPGLDTIRALCAALGDPQKRFRAIHVAGTNGKGAVCAMLDAALRAEGARRTGDVGHETRMIVGRYTSPHLVRLNERFFLDGAPVDDATLDRIAGKVALAEKKLECLVGVGERKTTSLQLHTSTSTTSTSTSTTSTSTTFFEALTAVAFELYAEAKADHVVLECGLGGRLDATNICEPELCVITRIGLDHCDWLGDTVEKIAFEKAGIIKPGVPIVLGENIPSVRAVIEARAHELDAPFVYAPERANESEIPADFPLAGRFNRENAVTALAALKVLGETTRRNSSFFISHSSFSHVVWPGRFQRVGPFIIDGAHNPPAAHALAAALAEVLPSGGKVDLVFGACEDKDVGEVLRILKPFVRKAYAVRTNNPRSLAADVLAERMRAEGLDATPCSSLAEALRTPTSNLQPSTSDLQPPHTLICGSLFLAGEAIVALNACPWASDRFDPSERHRPL